MKKPKSPVPTAAHAGAAAAGDRQHLICFGGGLHDRAIGRAEPPVTPRRRVFIENDGGHVVCGTVGERQFADFVVEQEPELWP